MSDSKPAHTQTELEITESIKMSILSCQDKISERFNMIVLRQQHFVCCVTREISVENNTTVTRTNLVHIVSGTFH